MSRTVRLALALAVAGAALPVRASAQEVGFGLGEADRYYSDPGNGGGSAYMPFYDPYRYQPPLPLRRHDYGGRAYTGYSEDPNYGRQPQATYVDPYEGGRDPYNSGGRYDLGENAHRTTRVEVENPTRQPPGTIVIDTNTRHLYYTQAGGMALQYGIGVGRQGFSWHGTAKVARKAEWPGWTPPAAMLTRRPDLPLHMEGGIDNPLGARALYLFNGKGDTGYRIHGTNEPDTIGQAVSSGCIRMMNADVIDLYGRVPVGTRVVVL